jgi:hypothetical protein
MIKYRVAGRSTATDGTINYAYGALWNASATKSIYVLEIHVIKTVGTVDNHALTRITARGTPASTVTPDIDNNDDWSVAPASGALLDLGTYSAQPTLLTPALMRTNLPATIGSGFVWIFPDPGIRVDAGDGLAITSPVAVIGQPADITYVWWE